MKPDEKCIIGVDESQFFLAELWTVLYIRKCRRQTNSSFSEIPTRTFRLSVSDWSLQRLVSLPGAFPLPSIPSAGTWSLCGRGAGSFCHQTAGGFCRHRPATGRGRRLLLGPSSAEHCAGSVRYLEKLKPIKIYFKTNQNVF